MSYRAYVCLSSVTIFRFKTFNFFPFIILEYKNQFSNNNAYYSQAISGMLGPITKNPTSFLRICSWNPEIFLSTPSLKLSLCILATALNSFALYESVVYRSFCLSSFGANSYLIHFCHSNSISQSLFQIWHGINAWEMKLWGIKK